MKSRRTIVLFLSLITVLFLVSACENPVSSDDDMSTPTQTENGDESGNGDEPAIGDVGPAGGHIFYIDESDEFDWTYLEAAPVETEWEFKQYGGRGTSIGQDARGTAIGTGASNTTAIVAAYGEQEPDNSDSEYAAKLTDDLVHNGFSDWFLPSRDELSLMYENLHEENIGDFSDVQYWSSSEVDAENAWRVIFTSGTLFDFLKSNVVYVRAVRAF